MPRSRLPSPPSSSKSQKDARPLPPEPAAEDAPPPLPARPPGPGGPNRGKQPPPPSRPQPTQEDSDDESEQATYEEPEPAPPVAPPPSTIRKPPPVIEESSGGGEIYDDLDEVIEGDEFKQDDTYDPPDEESFQQETYDECEIKEAKQQPAAPVRVDVQEELYELPPNEEEDLIEETEYEFVPDEKTRTPTPPAPPVPQPSLPARPPPTRKQEPAGENIPDLPSRPAVATPGGGKKQSPSSGGAPGMGISLGDISNVLGKLRKVSSEDKKESFESSDGSAGSQVRTDGSFQGKVNLFKQAEGDDLNSDSESSQHVSPFKQSLKPPGQDSPKLSPRSPKRSTSPQPNGIAGENTKFDFKPTIPVDTSNLSIKERIALMSGKSVGTGSNQPQPAMAKPAISKKPPTFKKPEGLGNTTLKDPPQASPKFSGPAKEEPKHTPEVQRSWNTTGYGSSVRSNSDKQKKFEQPDSPPPPPPPEPEENLEEDDIYDEGFTYKPPPDPLAEFEWYHRELDRHKTESKLNAIGQDGAFLVRKSQRGGDIQPFTLVVLYKGHVYNLKIRKRQDTKVALGEEKPDELAFKDVPALISYHRNNDVVLVNLKENKQYKTLLTKFPTYGC